MTKSELYLWISAVLFVVGMAIIPVGGFTESNPYHDYYFYGFLVLEINLGIAVFILGFKDWLFNKKIKQDEKRY